MFNRDGGGVRCNGLKVPDDNFGTGPKFIEKLSGFDVGNPEVSIFLE